ncbi:MAG: ABC transporter ATP-binding protein [Candidatus Omnitrophica bacterium CG08_land_8_20_14_0_20_41_16]|uniref:ABC transporter ATP-binding protein n=1 Tax=Candidatus Sherwoodlollariibacterium unditelluris TaxID=1974757 RepID=A0A2G9YHH0_9BACT|nr:MAG: ABC transporter ATP-binding protein [Candidatus Omnitrophica bacterium CG23_combo_of_CG06-09_8_20_14_all_41_10]PIS33372.1 MAG: ABC transporter ATP-binding protein [Candidatus Omnitrophica bacterium CG08_land_8_20_14_0_20_41_16]
MITINNLSKNYGKKVLFENISLNINQGEKIGLIGPNGSGKSTLFSLILGEIESSSGEVRVNKNTHIGYLAQELSFSRPDIKVSGGIPPEAGNSEHTVLSELTEGDERILRLKKEKGKLEDKNEADSRRYGEVLHDLETLGFFELEHKAEKILMGLGFKERDFNRRIKDMSGGWQMRTLLAKLLVYHYDLLLLDEPTNYLDLNAALWLKDYLASFRGTFIMISHDRAFLTDVTNYTLILENGVITKVRGNYEHYEQIKTERRTHLEKQFKEQEKKREQLEKFISRFHAQPNKAAAVRSKRTALERIEKEAIVLPPNSRKSIDSFSFPQARRSGHKIIQLDKVSKSYADTQVYNELDFEIAQGEKAVLVGENGAGKSTLLKILAGVVDINGGLRTVGHNVDIGYFSQTRTDILNVENTVLREVYSAASGYMPEETIRTILGAFLFTGDDVDKKVKVLSGGEKSRLILAKLLINPPNFLLLDEPTTHLDVDAVEALVRALTDYQGTLVFISHDIYFVRSVANMVYEVKAGRIRKFPGAFDYYLEKKDSTELIVEHKKPKFDSFKQKIEEERERVKEEEKIRKAEDKKRKAHNAALRIEITKLDIKKEKLRIESYAKARALSDPKFYQDENKAREYGRRLKEIEREFTDIDMQIKKLESQII